MGAVGVLLGGVPLGMAGRGSVGVEEGAYGRTKRSDTPPRATGGMRAGRVTSANPAAVARQNL